MNNRVSLKGGVTLQLAAKFEVKHGAQAFVVRTADVTGSDQLMTSSVLHVRCGTEVRQYAVHVTRQGHWRLADADCSFPTLVDLIAYYCEPNRCAL